MCVSLKISWRLHQNIATVSTYTVHKVELVAIGDESTLSFSCTGYTAVEEFTPGEGWKRRGDMRLTLTVLFQLGNVSLRPISSFAKSDAVSNSYVRYT